MKASGEAGSALFGKAWQAADEHGRKDAKEKGQTIETLAPAEIEKWRPMLETGRPTTGSRRPTRKDMTGAKCSTICAR